MNRIRLYAVIFSLCAMFSACDKTSVSPSSNDKTSSKLRGTGVSAQSTTPAADTINNGNCLPVVTNFYAGQHMLAGNITVTNDLTNIYVTFTTTDGWQMGETHLYVGPMSGLPANKKGNPKIGNFPYKATHSPAVTSYTYTVPLSTLGTNPCVIVAAHAAVFQVDSMGNQYNAQTAWGAGTQLVNGGSWASYFDYCVCDGGNTGSGGGNDGVGGGN